MELIHNNYLRSSGTGQTWKVEIDSPSRPIKTFFEETCIAAEIIWSQKKSPLHLCYSGGSDSEYILNVFLFLGMKIRPVIMKTQYNGHDTEYAFRFCKNKNIDPIVIDLDYDKFIDSPEFLKIATETKCCAFQYISNLWLLSQIDGTVITGDSDPHLTLNSHDKLWYVDEWEPVYRQLDYWKTHNIEGTPFTINHTAEQFLSFLLEPTIQKLANNEIPGKTGSYSSKIHIYNNQDKFNLELRPKYTGYELVENSPIYQHPHIQLLNSWKKDLWGIQYYEYYELIDRLKK